MLGRDDVARLHHLGRVGHNHGKLTIGWEQGSTVSKTVRNGNKRGKCESLELGAHWWVSLNEEEHVGVGSVLSEEDDVVLGKESGAWWRGGEGSGKHGLTERRPQRSSGREGGGSMSQHGWR